MRATPLSSRAFQRRGDNGAVLVVVLLVMMALLGMGLTGLYLTTGSIQMNANINMRNQALQVAEAGIQRAKDVLNRRGPPGWDPNISGLLTGTRSPSGQVLGSLPVPDAIPTSLNDCTGGTLFKKGAVLRDEPSTVLGCANGSAYFDCDLTAMTDPNDPNTPRSLGKYTVFIRQDQAECRVGSFTCDLPDPACPANNGIVVIRSEGTASDQRTMVALEVTMARNPNPSIANVQLATVCPAGQAGCDDNASVQQGITVSGALTPPPPGGGTTGTSGTAGASGSGGATGGGSGGSTTSPAGGSAQSGGAAGGGAGGGGAGGSSSSSSGCPAGQSMCGSVCCGGTCISNQCCPAANHCNNIAVIGEYGIWGSNGQFNQWLSTHSSSCNSVTTLDFEGGSGWTSTLNNYGILIVLDLLHTKAEVASFYSTRNYWVYSGNDGSGGKQRILSDPEVNVVKNWVKSGRGLITTIGVSDVTRELTNQNKLLAPFNLQYDTTKPKWFLEGVNVPNSPRVNCWINGGNNTCHWKWVASPLDMSNVTNLQVDNGWALKSLGWGPVTFAEPLATTKYYSWGKLGMVLDNNTNVMGSPAGQGRVVAWADEWLTYDQDWTATTECPAVADPSTPYWRSNLNSCTQRFWNNIINWLNSSCH